MKKVLAQGTKYVFGVFGIAILGLLMSLTYQALQRIFPTSFINTIWGLVLFDIAAICWALTFVYGSETVTQYAVSAIGFLTGFLGTLGMVAAEVILGQALFTTNAEQISQWLVYGFIGATAIHAALLYGHHASSQAIKQRIDVGIARGEITTEAIKQATATLDAERVQLAETITREIVDQVKRDLNIPILADPRMPFLPADPNQFQQTTNSPALTKDEPLSAEPPFPT
jgi:apolipoprotein N-acyltransferase